MPSRGPCFPRPWLLRAPSAASLQLPEPCALSLHSRPSDWWRVFGDCHRCGHRQRAGVRAGARRRPADRSRPLQGLLVA
eukprot:3677373-Prymnesium_polylepis.1